LTFVLFEDGKGYWHYKSVTELISATPVTEVRKRRYEDDEEVGAESAEGEGEEEGEEY